MQPSITKSSIIPTPGLCRVFSRGRARLWGTDPRCWHNQRLRRSSGRLRVRTASALISAVRRPLQRVEVELRHLASLRSPASPGRGHCRRAPRPARWAPPAGTARTLLQPIALSRLAALGELAPVVVDVLRGLAVDHKRDRLIELELRPTVQRHEWPAVQSLNATVITSPFLLDGLSAAVRVTAVMLSL